MGAFELGSKTVVYVSPDGSCHNLKPCFTTIQAAVNWAGSENFTVDVAQGKYAENLILNEDKQVLLNGGWNYSFSQKAGTSSIKSLYVSKGTVTGWGLVIEP